MKLDKIFALATDTIWGLACLAEDLKAVQKVFELKGREYSQPLVLFVENLKAAEQLQHIPKELIPWLNKHWPGGLTFVSQAISEKYKHCHPLTGTIGIRIPDHLHTLSILKTIQKPLAVTSLNRSGEAPVKDLDEILTLFPEYPLKAYGIMPTQSSESCIIALDGTDLKVLRGSEKQIRSFGANLPSGFRIVHNNTRV